MSSNALLVSRCVTAILLLVLPLETPAQDSPVRVVTDRVGNVFAPGEAVSVVLRRIRTDLLPACTLRWELRDWRARVLQSGTTLLAEGQIDVKLTLSLHPSFEGRFLDLWVWPPAPARPAYAGLGVLSKIPPGWDLSAEEILFGAKLYTLPSNDRAKKYALFDLAQRIGIRWHSHQGGDTEEIWEELAGRRMRATYNGADVGPWQNPTDSTDSSFRDYFVGALKIPAKYVGYYESLAQGPTPPSGLRAVSQGPDAFDRYGDFVTGTLLDLTVTSGMRYQDWLYGTEIPLTNEAQRRNYLTGLQTMLDRRDQASPSVRVWMGEWTGEYPQRHVPLIRSSQAERCAGISLDLYLSEADFERRLQFYNDRTQLPILVNETRAEGSTEREIAEDVVKRYVVAWSQGCRHVVDAIFCYKGSVPEHPDWFQRQLVAFDPKVDRADLSDLNPRPAYFTLYQMARRLEGARFVRRIPLAPDHARAYLFELQNGSSVIVAWNRLKGSSVPAMVAYGGKYAILDAMGDVVQSGGSLPFTFALGEELRYVCLSSPAAGISMTTPPPPTAEPSAEAASVLVSPKMPWNISGATIIPFRLTELLNIRRVGEPVTLRLSELVKEVLTDAKLPSIPITSIALEGPRGERIPIQVDEADGTGFLRSWGNGILDPDDEITFKATQDAGVEARYHLFLNIPSGSVLPQLPLLSTSEFATGGANRPYYHMSLSNSVLTAGIHSGETTTLGPRALGSMTHLRLKAWGGGDDVFQVHSSFDNHYPNGALTKDLSIRWDPLDVIALGPIRAIVAIRGSVDKEFLETEGALQYNAQGRLQARFQRQFILHRGLPQVEIREVFQGDVDPDFAFKDSLSMPCGAQRYWADEEMHVPTAGTPSGVFVLKRTEQVGRVTGENLGSLPGNAGQGWWAYARGGSAPRTVINFFDEEHSTASGPISLLPSDVFNPATGVGPVPFPPSPAWYAKVESWSRSNSQAPVSASIVSESRGDDPWVLDRMFLVEDRKLTPAQTQSCYLRLRKYSLQSTVIFEPPVWLDLASGSSPCSASVSLRRGGAGIEDIRKESCLMRNRVLLVGAIFALFAAVAGMSRVRISAARRPHPEERPRSSPPTELSAEKISCPSATEPRTDQPSLDPLDRPGIEDPIDDPVRHESMVLSVASAQDRKQELRRFLNDPGKPGVRRTAITLLQAAAVILDGTEQEEVRDLLRETGAPLPHP